jgi:glutamate racemase
VKIISDDADVFVLACYHYPNEREDVTVYMEPTKKVRCVTNIGETVRKHFEIIPSIVPAHAISGCDSVCHLTGIGKTTVVKTMQNKSLVHIGNLDSPMAEVVTEATDFIGECYNISSGKDMSEKR